MCADDDVKKDPVTFSTEGTLKLELPDPGELDKPAHRLAIESMRAKLAELERDERARLAPVRIAEALERIACSNATLAAEAQRQSWSLERSEALERACVAVALAVVTFIVVRHVAARYFE